jgi:hypothetical protein
MFEVPETEELTHKIDASPSEEKEVHPIYQEANV